MTANEESKLVRLRDHLDEFLAVYAGISIALGLITGYYKAGWVTIHRPLVKELEMAAIMLMIFPMMIMLDIAYLGKAFKNWKALTVSLLMNFGWGPLWAVILGDLFLHNQLLKLGLFIAWLVPCSSMSVGYVGLMKGNIELATALVVVSFLVAVPLIPLYIKLYGAAYHVIVPTMVLIKTIILVIIAPLIVGVAMHEALVKRLGMERFRRISPLFPTITMLGMFMIIFEIFFGSSKMIITYIHSVLGVFYSAMVFGTISLTFLTLFLRSIRFKYRDAMATLFPSIGKNEGTAIAIAATAFSPLVAIAPATLPVFQVVFLLTYIKLRSRIMSLYRVGSEKVIFKIKKVAPKPFTQAMPNHIRHS